MAAYRDQCPREKEQGQHGDSLHRLAVLPCRLSDAPRILGDADVDTGVALAELAVELRVAECRQRG